MKEILIKPPKQHRAIRKFHQVLDAVPVAVALYGFKKTTAAKLALEAEISIGSFYDYFSCKEAAFIAFLDRELDNALTKVAEDACNAKGNAEGVIRLLVSTGLTFVTSHPMLIKGMLMENPMFVQNIDLTRSKQRIAEIGIAFAESHQLRLTDKEPNLMIYSLTNVVLGFQLRIGLMGDEQYTRDQVINEMTDIISHYLFLNETTKIAASGR
ncbi:Uncharacterised protein [BD1-7 clade bacterium]|uniref:HTH tetR-type domain-containing protein n=1 Tax=BD1-7 clade bacterium TaxID=2029982 RepID=A0A5S9NLB6_9GAMM|nr:Uncharacterised protein [BD1-7 clade bacterium]CAA0093636.1 Uncharacterised protein [BD1-7 clade bacterium]